MIALAVMLSLVAGAPKHGKDHSPRPSPVAGAAPKAPAKVPPAGERPGEGAADQKTWAGPTAAKATADKDQVRLGEPFTVTVEVKHPPDQSWTFDERQKLEPFALISQSQSHESAGKLEVTKLTLKVALFKLDANPVPDLKLLARDAGGAHPFSLPGPTVKGVAPDLGKDKNRRDIHAPVPVVVKSYRLLWLGLGILAALGLALWVFLWWRGRPKRAALAPEAPIIPADEAALTALATLEGEGLPRQGLFKEFHLRLSTILRSYLARRYGIAAMDMTSSELLDELGRLSTDGLKLADLSWICHEGDLAKFAKAQPSPDDCKEAISLVRQLVTRTRTRPTTTGAMPAQGVAG